jgi:pyridoxal/pyridoxine/pyridoxamine kinase
VETNNNARDAAAIKHSFEIAPNLYELHELKLLRWKSLHQRI